VSEEDGKNKSFPVDVKIEDKLKMLNELSGILSEFKNIFQPTTEGNKDNPPKSPDCNHCGCGVCPYNPKSILLKGSKGRRRG